MTGFDRAILLRRKILGERKSGGAKRANLEKFAPVLSSAEPSMISRGFSEKVEHGMKACSKNKQRAMKEAACFGKNTA